MSVKTEFGTAYESSGGYLVISSVKEGNLNKYVHRLVFEKFYNIKLPSDIHIHHEDGNKLNNEIWNLVPMTNKEHSTMHHVGVKFSEERCKNISESKKGYKFSEESKQKMRDAKLGTTQSLDTMIARSKSNTSTGIFRVIIKQNKSCKKGWSYAYGYVENGKRKYLNSVDIYKLKEKVLSKGLEWIILDEEKAAKILNK